MDPGSPGEARSDSEPAARSDARCLPLRWARVICRCGGAGAGGARQRRAGQPPAPPGVAVKREAGAGAGAVGSRAFGTRGRAAKNDGPGAWSGAMVALAWWLTAGGLVVKTSLQGEARRPLGGLRALPLHLDEIRRTRHCRPRQEASASTVRLSLYGVRCPRLGTLFVFAIYYHRECLRINNFTVTV